MERAFILLLGILLIPTTGLCDDKAALKAACDEGVWKSCDEYWTFEMDRGDIEAAKKFWKEACDAGNPRGCYYHGWSENREGNSAEAGRAFKIACDGKVAGGCEELERIGDREALRKAHKFGCDRGDMNDCYELARLEKGLGNAEAARELWGKACSGAEKRSCQSLEDMKEVTDLRD